MPRLEAALHPDRASAAALLIAPDERYLLQWREDLPHVSYPGYWGLFGGAVEAGENPAEAISRELAEELAAPPPPLRYLTRVVWDMRPDTGAVWERTIFVGRLDDQTLQTLRPTEGAGFSLFSGAEIERMGRVVPQDRIAIDLYEHRFEHVSARRESALRRLMRQAGPPSQ